MARDRLRRRPRSAGDLGNGEAAVLGGTGGPVAGYRDEGGVLHAVSAICTHMGRVVQWNDAERSLGLPLPRLALRSAGAGASGARHRAARRWALGEDEDGQRAQAS